MKKANQFRQILLAILAVAALAAACFPFTDFIGYRSVALILLLLVSILALRMSLPAVLVAAVVSALVWDFFFIPPHFTFTIGSGEDVLLLLMYFIVALLNGAINYRMRQFEREKTQKEKRENALKLYGTLFDSLSHELRTPVAAILGAADMLQENEARLSVSQKKELLDEIAGSSMRLSEQVENLLNMSRLETGVIAARKEWCDVADLLFGIVKKLEKEGKNHPVERSIPEDLPLVRLDFGLTEQVVQNLLANAFRHTPDGTQVFISVKMQKAIAGHFEKNGAAVEHLQPVKDVITHRLEIEISDNGPGFPANEIDRAFDKFYRPENTRADGTGLGLYIVKGFTEAQGGEVSLGNRVGGGSRFLLEFPTAILNQTFHQHE